MKVRNFMNKYGLIVIMLLTIICMTLYAFTKSLSEAEAGERFDVPVGAFKVVDVKNGLHGSVWKFVDVNRTCYIYSSGGIWCNR